VSNRWPQRVGVVGLGQIGGSIARALLQRGQTVLGHDLDAATRTQAQRDGLAVSDGLPALLHHCDLVVLALPLDRYGELLPALRTAAADHRPRVLMDVGSSSVPFRQLATDLGPCPGLTLVGSHPMAGTERSGYAAADPGLFQGCTWPVLYSASAGASALLRLMDFVLRFGASTLLLDAPAHDQAVARVSHLPHALASSLVSSALALSAAGLHRSLAAGSFRDGSRVMHSAPGLVSAMCLANAHALVPALDDAIAALQGLRQSLQAGDASAVIQRFDQAHRLVTEPVGGVPAPATRRVQAASEQALLEALRACGRAGERLITLHGPDDHGPHPCWTAELLPPHPGP
jgi:prephenate dehydrogenase